MIKQLSRRLMRCPLGLESVRCLRDHCGWADWTLAINFTWLQKIMPTALTIIPVLVPPWMVKRRPASARYMTSSIMFGDRMRCCIVRISRQLSSAPCRRSSPMGTSCQRTFLHGPLMVTLIWAKTSTWLHSTISTAMESIIQNWATVLGTTLVGSWIVAPITPNSCMAKKRFSGF